jgi:hypothetical protein
MAATSPARPDPVVIDGFEVDEGHFASNPNIASGTSQGFIKAGATAATAERILTDFFTGTASQIITLDDDPTVPGSPASLDSWRLRHLSGGGTPANNLSLTNVSGDTTFVGYYLKTSSPGLEAAISIDDGAALELSEFQPIAADGLWHLYQWQLQDAADWNPFAGTGPNGQIDSASVTIDSVFFRAGAGFPIGSDFDAVFYIDDISWNPTGQIPEPSSALLLALGGLLICRRHRRY